MLSILISGRKNVYESKSPNNSTGLCNQLFHVINSIYLGKNNDIYFDKFSKDYRSGDLLPLSSILNLEEMNNRWNYHLHDFTSKDQIFIRQINPIGYVFQCYNQDRKQFSIIAKRLKFQQRWENIANKWIEAHELTQGPVNVVHLRIEDDLKRHLGNDSYQMLFTKYKNAILTHFSKEFPLVLLLEEVDHPFVKELIEMGYKVHFTDKRYDDTEITGREMHALIDLLIGKNLKIHTFIGAEGTIFTSSFSVFLKSLIEGKSRITMI